MLNADKIIISSIEVSNNNNFLKIVLYKYEKKSESRYWEAPYITLTENLNIKTNKDEGFVNITKYKWAEKFIKENKIGEKIKSIKINKTEYTLYKFNLNELSKYEIQNF